MANETLSLGTPLSGLHGTPSSGHPPFSQHPEREEQEDDDDAMEEEAGEGRLGARLTHWQDAMVERLRASGVAGAEASWNDIHSTTETPPPFLSTMPAVSETLSPLSAKTLLTSLVSLWIPDPPTPLHLQVPFAYSLLGVPYDPYTPPSSSAIAGAKKSYNRLRCTVTSLMINFESLSLPNHDPTFLSPPTPSCGMSGLQAFHKLSIALKLAKQLVLWDYRHRSLYLPQAASTLSAFSNPWETYVPSFTATCNEKKSSPDYQPHQVIVMVVLRNLMKEGMVLMKGDEQGFVWQQIVSSTGYASHAWKPKMKLLDYVFQVLKPVNNWDKWKLQTEGRWGAKFIADHLAEQPFPQLPRLTMCRSTWSFQNGIYDGAANCFLEYETDNIPEDVVACKYIDNFFEPSWVSDDLEDIMNDGRPLCADKILQDQGFDAKERSTVFAMLGRMFFWVGQYDNWHSFPAFIGSAGTGKSSLLNQIVMFYPSQFVRQLSGKEATFGLQTLQSAWLIIVYEITPLLANMFDSILSMAAGEKVYIAKKNLQAEHVKIKAPFGMAGNQTFGKDTAGNMARRMLGVLFHKRIVAANTQMKLHQKQDMARFVVYAIRTYQNLVDLCKNKDLLQFLPGKFRETRREMVANINPLQSFVHRESLIFRHPHNIRPMFQNADAGAKITLDSLPFLPWDIFMSMAITHSQRRSLPRPTFDEAIYSYIFDEYGLYLLKNVRYTWIKIPPTSGRNNNPSHPMKPLSEIPPVPQEGNVVLGLGLKEFAPFYANNDLCILSSQISLEA